jgi:WXG100 family type VII secretion target
MGTKNTVNIQRMRSAASELDNIYNNMQKQIRTLDDTMGNIKKVWAGDAAKTYLDQYDKNYRAFVSMATAVMSASNALNDSCNTYDQADNTAMDIVQKMGKRG